MKVYVSGPMTGKKKWNFPAFKQAVKKLVALGYNENEIYTPLKIAQDYLDGTINATEMLSEETADVVMCDAIYMLKGWQYSWGAKRELQIAMLHEKEILLEE